MKLNKTASVTQQIQDKEDKGQLSEDVMGVMLLSTISRRGGHKTRDLLVDKHNCIHTDRTM